MTCLVKLVLYISLVNIDIIAGILNSGCDVAPVATLEDGKSRSLSTKNTFRMIVRTFSRQSSLTQDILRGVVWSYIVE